MKTFTALLFLVIVGIALATEADPSRSDAGNAKRDSRFLGLFGGYGYGYPYYGGGYYGGYYGSPYGGYGGYYWG